MRSKITFDLGDDNSATIKAEVCLTSDIRDKVAKQFFENLAYGNLISARFVKEEKENCDRLESVSANTTATIGVWELKPVRKIFIPYEDLEENQHKIKTTGTFLLSCVKSTKTGNQFCFLVSDEQTYNDFKGWGKVNPSPYTFEFQDPNNVLGSEKLVMSNFTGL